MSLTAEQMARRAEGLGASEAAAAIGMGRFARPIDVWRRKCGFAPDAQVSFAQERGNFLEDGMRRWYADRERRRVALSDTLAHPEDPRILATPDGIVEGTAEAPERLLLEIKVPGRWTAREWGEPGSDQVPDDYLVQATWGMAVAGLRRAHVVALLQDDLAVFVVPYAPELFAEVRAAAMDFWERYVVPQREPPVDGSASYADYLAGKYSRVREGVEVVRAGRNQAAWVRRYQEARYRAKQAEEQKREAQNHLKAIMGEAEEMESDYGRVTWRAPGEAQATDWRAVAQEAGASPELIRRHTRSQPKTRAMKVADISPQLAANLRAGHALKRIRKKTKEGAAE